VIAGRDNRVVAAIVAFLRALGLRVIEWEQAVAKTGLPNPYVGNVVETGLRMADVAVVLLTPDDVVRLRADLLRDDDGPNEQDPRGQARPNVYYEAGLADASDVIEP
jgi:predicted nucleotide-binding protein